MQGRAGARPPRVCGGRPYGDIARIDWGASAPRMRG